MTVLLVATSHHDGMTQPPIVPGPQDPDPTTGMPPQPQYQSVPPPPDTSAQQFAGKVAGGTVIVILTIFGLVCVLPLLACGIFGWLGSLNP